MMVLKDTLEGPQFSDLSIKQSMLSPQSMTEDCVAGSCS